MARDIHSQSIPLPKFPMSAFDLGHSIKGTYRIGKMIPHYVEEVIPSDIAHIRTDIFARLDPLTFPIMHRLKVRQNFFFVPFRLVLGDELTEEFFSCKDLAAKLPQIRIQSDDPTAPTAKNSIFDYFECQPHVYGPAGYYLVRNPLPFCMYQLIWKDWYADEIFDAEDISRVEDTLLQMKNYGLNSVIDFSAAFDEDFFKLRPVSYSKDRFTCAQPDAQRVGEVYLMNPLTLEVADSGSLPSEYRTIGISSSGIVQYTGVGSSSLRPTLTIDELWDEMAVQRFLNSLNEFGNERYVEILAGQFGVISADARLQRPQWLGGNEVTVNISEVLQTSQTSDDSPLGAYAGRGIVFGRGRDISFRVPEHGFIIGILSLVPENGYASGSPRWLYKQSPLDFAMPRFNNLGEQAVFNGELYSDGRPDEITKDLNEFGYQPQYDEYRSHISRAVGGFRDSGMLAWHLDRKFSSPPPLNENFIHVGSEVNRIFNDTSDIPHVNAHCFHKALYVRPISKHPVPGKL